MNKELLEFIKILSLNDKKTLIGKALKTTEEVGELAKVVLPFENAPGTLHRFTDKEKILDSVADVILCALSIGYQLDFSHDEIIGMIEEKSRKWQEIQVREDKVKYPLPYEIHITVERPADDVKMGWFTIVCNELGVKPIVIDLQKDNETVMLDVMTSSVHYGDNRSAYDETKRITERLGLHFKVLRTKIETVPWHPAAPIKIGDVMPLYTYFESHIKVITTEDKMDLLNLTVKEVHAHLSRNPFKELDNGEIIMMVTHRKYNGIYLQFLEEVENITSILFKRGFKYQKIEVEFSIYDTKISHDSKWLTEEDSN